MPIQIDKSYPDNVFFLRTMNAIESCLAILHNSEHNESNSPFQ